MWEYLLIFILSATPWIEILFVIPLAIATGLHPLPVALVAFTGNFIPIIAIAYFYDQWEQWRIKRKRRHDTNSEEDVIQHHESKRKKLGRKIWDKCGLPGLALLSPIVTGAHLAAVIALLSRSPRASILFWMFCSLAIWTVILTAGTHCGLDFFGFKFE